MKKILLIRSSQLLFTKIATQLVERGDCEITALVANDVPNEDILRLGVKDIIRLPGEKGFRYRDAIAYARSIGKQCAFHEVIVLYNNRTGSGYLNVDVFAALTKAHVRSAYNYDCARIELTGGYLAGKAWQELRGCLWLLTNTVFAVLVFSAICLGMIGVEVAHRLRRK